MKRLVLLSVFLLLIVFSASAQCAMCKAVAETDNGGQAAGLNNAILYLMAVPYLFLMIVLIFFRKKAKLFFKEFLGMWN